MLGGFVLVFLRDFRWIYQTHDTSYHVYGGFRWILGDFGWLWFSFCDLKSVCVCCGRFGRLA